MHKPEDFEVGDEPIRIRMSDAPGLRVAICLSYDEVERAEALATERGVTLPQFVRQLVLDAIASPSTTQS